MDGPLPRGLSVGQAPLELSPLEPASQPRSLRHLFDHGQAFFSLGLLRTRVPGGRDQLADYMLDSGKQLTPTLHVLPEPMFRGIGVDDHGVDWDRSLLALPLPQLVDLNNWLGTVRYLDSGRNWMGDVRFQFVPIVDQLEMARLSILPDKLPVVTIAVYCLRGSDRCHFVRTDVKPPFPAVHSPGWDATAKMRDAILSGDSDPYRVVEPPAGVLRNPRG